MTAVLYISYDGMLEPLGQSQVLGYLERLAADHAVHLVSFEKKNDRADKGRVMAMKTRLKAAGISWTPLAYHKTPTAPATAFDIAIGTLVSVWLGLRHRVTIVHARSYVPAVMALAVKRMTGARFLFDMRGFWADERVDGGLWPKEGRLYRLTKALEARLLKSADYVVTLTHASAREIAGFDYLQDSCPPVQIIPTCADLERFRPHAQTSQHPFTLGYVGSVGTWYLFDEVLRFYKQVCKAKPNARLLIINRNEHDFIRKAIEAAGIPMEKCDLLAAEHHEVQQFITRMNAGMALIKPVYSKMASAPTKLAEYLGCGIPCVGNINVGDMKEILEDEGVGVALTDFSDGDHKIAADRLLALLDEPGLQIRCVETAKRWFSLDTGVEAYRDIYNNLAGRPRTRQEARQ